MLRKLWGLPRLIIAKLKSVEEDGYKNLGILEYDDLLQGQKKNVLKKEYFRRLKTVQRQWENAILATNS